MRRLSCLVGVLLLLWPLSACDSDDPTEIDSQNLGVTISSTNGLVDVYNVWDLFRDRNCLPADPMMPIPETQCSVDADCAAVAGSSGVCGADGTPDDITGDGVGDVFDFCQQAVDSGGTPVTTTVANLPWNFTARISVLREGRSVPTVVTESFNAAFNLTDYDDTTSGAPICPQNVPPPPLMAPPIPCPDPNNAFFYSNPREISQANRFMFDNNGVNGSCPGNPLGDSGIAGVPMPIRINVSKGDTVIVEARKDITGPVGFPILSEPALAGSITLDGRPVTPDGTIVSDSTPAAGISFSFTVR
jgi:hypothetical protein